MQNDAAHELSEKDKSLEALYREEKSEKFRAYWQKEAETARSLALKVKKVVLGETAVSPEVIGECKVAVLRLNQIAYALRELARNMDSNGEAITEAMSIVMAHEELARDAATNLVIMAEWTKKAKLDS